MHYLFRVAESDRTFQEEDEEWTQREEMINNESQVKTKKGTKKEGRVWQHDETIRLIDLWSGEKCLSVYCEKPILLRQGEAAKCHHKNSKLTLQ